MPSLPSKQDVQYVALYKICTCPRRDRHSRAFPVEDVLSACSSHRPSCPPAPCRGGLELVVLLLLDQVLRTGGVVNDHRLTLKLTRRSQSSSPFLSSPQLGTRGSTTAYFHRQGGAAVRNPPPTRTAPQLTQLLSPNIIALSLRLTVGIGIIVSSIQSESPT